MPNVRPINLDITLENKIKLWARFMHRYRPIVYLALTTSSSSHFVFYPVSFLFFSSFIYIFFSFISYLEILFIYFFLLLRATSDVFYSCFWDFHFYNTFAYHLPFSFYFLFFFSFVFVVNVIAFISFLHENAFSRVGTYTNFNP